MGDRVREGQADIRQAAEASERQLFAETTDFLPASLPLVQKFHAPTAVPRHSAEKLPKKLAWWTVRIGAKARRAFVSAVMPGRLGDALQTELDRGAAFLLVPVFLAIGALVYFGLPIEPKLISLVGAMLFLSALFFSVRSRQWLHLVTGAALLIVVGLTVAKLETWRMATKVLGAEISTRLTGRVAAIDHLANGRVRLIIDVGSTERPTLRYAPERVRLTARRIAQEIKAGSTVAGYVRLMPPSGPVRPDSYDFSFESYFDGIGASGFFMKGPEIVASDSKMAWPDTLLARVENARDGIAAHIRNRIGGPEGEIAAALVVGVRGGIPEEVNEALRRTDLYHIISISGLHMALVAGTVMGFLRAGFALFPGFSSRWPVRKYAAFAALLSTGSYLFISGAEVAAQRSFIMLAVMLTALLVDRAALTMRNLAISAVIVILISPHEVAGPSFQMSFAATAALVGAYAWWSDRRANRPPAALNASVWASASRKVVGVMVGLAMTSVIAGAATGVFGAWHFQRVSPLSLVANLAVMPIVSIAVMPFAVIAAALMPFGLDGPFLDIMGKGLAAMIAMSEWISVRSPVDAVGLIPVSSVVFVTMALVIASMTTTRLRAAALPFAVLGVLMLGAATPPDILISEDGRLVGVPLGNGELALNRSRPNRFTIDNWKRALLAERLVGPQQVTGAHADSGGAATAFTCDDGLCLARHPSGAQIAHAENAEAARRACDSAALIVFDDATAKNMCADHSVTVITKRELARHGSAAVFLVPAKPGNLVPTEQGSHTVEISHAIAEPYRPWHVQRQFSREARGQAPYKRKETTAPAAENVPATDQTILGLE